MRVSLVLVGLLCLAACAAPPAPVTPNPTLALSATPVLTPTVFVRPTLPPRPSATPDPDLSPTPVVAVLEPLTGLQIAPPIRLQAPAAWRVGYDTILYNELGDLVPLPFALFEGPVTGGTGKIVLLWGFRSIVGSDPLGGGVGQANLWVDGLRLLRLVVFDPQCNIGTDIQLPYSVGGLESVGTQFSAIDCPNNLPDTRGWFVGVNVQNTNFAFYVYTDPIQAMDVAVPELQRILDSVEFRLPSSSAEATEAP